MNYYIYIGAAVVVLGLILMIIGIVTARNKHHTEEINQEVTKEITEDVQEIEKTNETEVHAESEAEPIDDSISEKTSDNTAKEEPIDEPLDNTTNEEPIDEPQDKINQLIQNYYTAYASGNTDEVEKYATPVSELEKSYIKLMSNYIKATENIQCFIKEGLQEGDYAVSVVADMYLDDVDTAAPGLEFFYVRTNKDGAYYIDNVYCSFNTSVHVMDVDQKVMAFISDYESDDEFKILQSEVQNRYDELLASNDNLKTKLSVEIPQAVNEWMNTLIKSSNESKTDTNDVIPGKTLVVHDSYNIRTSRKDNAKKLGSTKKGDELRIIKNYTDGWTEIKWNKETGYIKTKLLIENK